MNLFEAISEMRRLTREGKSFSFSFMSYNSTKGTSEGIVYVRKAKLLQRESLRLNRNAEEMERYQDMETGEARRFWHPLLMDFNGEKVTL